MTEAAVLSCETHTLEWLALTLTPGLGPTKARHLVEHFGSVQAVFRASLTELEAAGIPAVAAQSLGTGRSLELANDELARAAGVQIVAFENAAYPSQLKQIYDPPLVLYVRGNVAAVAAGNRCDRHPPSHSLWDRNGRAPGV